MGSLSILHDLDYAWASPLRNNTLGTYHAALAAAEARCERFVLITADKAVNLPVRIVDLARQLIRLSGHSGDDVTIEFS